jgi:hypothetical protein
MGIARDERGLHELYLMLDVWVTTHQTSFVISKSNGRNYDDG